jgi:Fe-S-cluster containining protein
MILKEQANIPAGMNAKKQVLDAVYGVYSEWVERFPLACQKGCGACCTRSVTMTSLEGEVILDFARRDGREKWLFEKLSQADQGQSRATLTTNQFAAACLNHREVDFDGLENWDFTPCVFLSENTCAIYTARPFGCRSFGSLVPCAAESEAVMAPIHLAVNTVFTQVIEHLSSDGGYWSTMSDILHHLGGSRNPDREMHLLPARPVPGFLLEPHEVQVIQFLLQQLRGRFSEKGIFGDLIDNFMPI